jgi:hypothetical protein
MFAQFLNSKNLEYTIAVVFLPEKVVSFISGDLHFVRSKGHHMQHPERTDGQPIPFLWKSGCHRKRNGRRRNGRRMESVSHGWNLKNSRPRWPTRWATKVRAGVRTLLDDRLLEIIPPPHIRVHNERNQGLQASSDWALSHA